MSKVKDFSLDDLDDLLGDSTGGITDGLPSGLAKPTAGIINTTNKVDDDDADEEEDDDDDDADVDTVTKTTDKDVDNNTGSDDDDDDDDDFALPIAEEVFNELGFDFEFDPKEFKDTFGEGASGIKNFIVETIKQNSKPTFKTETAEKYFRFLEEGGNPEDLSSLLGVKTEFSKIDAAAVVENEELQKKVYSEYLKISNPKATKEWIDKKIARVDSAGLLEDEALEALEAVSEHYKEKENELLESVNKKKQLEAKQVEDYWNKETEEISKVQNIANVKVTKATKDKFLEYYKSGKFNQEVSDPKTIRELAFIKFLGIDEYVKVVTSKNAKDLDEKLKRYSSSRASGSNRIPGKTTQASDINEIEF